MATKLEKQFFDTFDIEPDMQKVSFPFKHNTMRMKIHIDYPQITDRHYLQLICCFHNNNSICSGGFNFVDICTLKTHLLKTFIQIMNNDIKDERKNKLKYQVQSIFKEI